MSFAEAARRFSEKFQAAIRVSVKGWVDNHAHVLKPKRNDIGYLTEFLESLVTATPRPV